MGVFFEALIVTDIVWLFIVFYRFLLLIVCVGYTSFEMSYFLFDLFLYLFNYLLFRIVSVECDAAALNLKWILRFIK